MNKALVLMKAMPPTVGHQALIEFASYFANYVTVLIDTARNEPMIAERVTALREIAHTLGNVSVHHIYFDPQDPNEPGFWEEWDKHLHEFDGYDFVIGSEDYIFKVAEKIGARYIPFDPSREMVTARGTDVRLNPLKHFYQIAPAFRNYMNTTVTIFGAESTGKTTLANEVAKFLPGPVNHIHEYARPYLKTLVPDINVQSMTDIYRGQDALQRRAAMDNYIKPFTVQDTDLFSTIGYWEQPHWEKYLGPAPSELIFSAAVMQSDLYVVCKSNIPFEAEDIRYGGDKRESSDEYWISVLEKYKLNYIVLESDDIFHRTWEVVDAVNKVAKEKYDKISFKRFVG